MAWAEVVARLHLDASGAKDEAERVLKTISGTAAGTKAGKEFTEGVKKGAGSPKVPVGADTKAGDAEVKAFTERLKVFAAQVHKARLDADDVQAKAKLAGLEVKLTELGKRVDKPKIEIDGLAKAEAELLAFRAEMDRAGKSSGSFEQKLSGAGSGLSSLVTAAVGFGPAVVPAFAVATAAAAGFGGIAVSAGSALGVFAFTAKAQFSDLTKGYTNIQKLKEKAAAAAPGSKEQAADYAKLAAAQQAYAKTFGPAATGMNNLHAAWDAWRKATAGQTNEILARGLNLVASALPKLRPLFDVGAAAANHFLGAIQGWMTGGGLDRLVAVLTRMAQQVMPPLERTIHNLAAAVGAAAPHFQSFAVQVANGLASITAKLAAWTSGAGNTAFTKFIDYVRVNGPRVGAALITIAQAAVQITKGLTPLAPVSLAVATALAKLIASCPPPVITALAVAFIAFSTASKLAGVAGAVTATAGALSKMRDLCLLTRIELGLLKAQEIAVAAATKIMTAAQWLLDAALTANPIGIVVVALAALAAAFYLAWTRSAAFRNVVEAAWRAVGTAASAAWAAIRVAVNGIIAGWNAVTGAFRAVMAWIASVFDPWWAQNGEAIKRIWSALWTAATAVFRATWVVLQAVAQAGWAVLRAVFTTGSAVLSATWRAAWVVIQAISQAGWAVLRPLFTAGMAVLSAVTRAGWVVIQSVTQVGWAVLRAVFTVGIAVVRAAWSVFSTVLISTARVMWATLQAIFKIAWDVIVAIFTVAINLLTGRWGAAWTAITNLGHQVWNALAAFYRTAWSALGAIWQSTLTGLSRVWSATWDGIKSVGLAAWNAIYRTIVSPLIDTFTKTIPNAFNTAVRAIGQFWTGLQNTVRTPVAWVVDNVLDGLIRVFDTITNAVGLGKPIAEVHPFGLAAGGKITKGTGPTADDVLVRVSRNETVVSAADSQVLAPAFAALRVPGYAAGGVPVGNRAANPPVSAGVGSRFGPVAGVGGVAPAIGKAIAGAAKTTAGAAATGAKAVGGAAVAVGRGIADAAVKAVDAGKMVAAFATQNAAAFANAFKSLLGAGAGGAGGVLAQVLTKIPTMIAKDFVDWIMGKAALASQATGSGADIAKYAESFLGKLPYVFGGNTFPTAVDCSSFVQGVYKHFGINAPRTSEAQGAWVKRGGPQSGGLAFYHSPAGGPDPGHVAMVKNASTVISHGGGMGPKLMAINGMPLLWTGTPPGGFGGAGGIGAIPSGPAVERWRATVLQALGLLHEPTSLANQVLHQIQTESGGDPGVTNTTDINAQHGDPSKGLLQVIGATFRAYHVAGTSNNVLDPLANIAAAINYAMHRYGPSLMSGGQGLGSGHGYAGGGWVNEPVTGFGAYSGALYSFGEAGREYVMPEAAMSGGGPDRLDRIARLLSQLIDTTAAVPARTGQAVGGTLSGSAAIAASRGYYAGR